MGLERYGNLAAGVGGFAEGFIKALQAKQDREDRLKETAEDRAFKKAQLGLMARDKGLLLNENEGQFDFQEDPSYKEEQTRLMQDKAALGAIPTGAIPKFEGGKYTGYDYPDVYKQITKDRAEADPYGLKAAQARNAGLILQKNQNDLIQDEIKNKEENRKRTSSPVVGYKKIDDAPIEHADARVLKSAKADKENFLRELEIVKQKTKELDKISPITSPKQFYNKRKELLSATAKLQLAYKGDAFAKLGVLAGPDVGFIEKVIENPTADILSGNADAVVQRFDELAKNTEDSFDSKFAQYGLEKEEGGKGLLGNSGVSAKPGEKIKYNGKMYQVAPNGEDLIEIK